MTRLRIYTALNEYQMMYEILEVALRDKAILEAQGYRVEVMGNVK
jgi:hypothetical protein